MGRTNVRALLAAGLVVIGLATAVEVHAAGEVVVAVSPSEVAVGQPVEVLLRTFRVVDRRDLSLPFESPIPPYPVPTGDWDVLYSWPDYPFDVVAQHAGDADIAVSLARDPSDSTLWRGPTSIPTAGTWTIWVRNFPAKDPGSTSTVTVRARGAPKPSPNVSTTGKPGYLAESAALLAALIVLVFGAAAALAWRRR